MKAIVSLILAVISFNSHASEFYKPWADAGPVIVLDTYEGNPIKWTKMATDHRVVGVVHRIAIGTRVDKKYFEREVSLVSFPEAKSKILMME